MRTFARVLLLCAVPLSACADSTGSGDGITGTYLLASVNGAPPPFTIYSTPPPSPIYSNQTSSGSLTFKSDQTFVIRLTAQLLKDGVVYNTIADSAGGTFSVAQNIVTYTYGYPSGGTRTGTVSGHTVTMDAEGNLYSFNKQTGL
jgi:hypothetical protein